MVQKPAGGRELIAGPETPQQPYPLRVRGPVIKGFGRGSKELGIPTANIPLEGLSIAGHTDLESGVYYGWASLDFSTIPSKSSSAEASESTAEQKKQQSSNHAVADLEASAQIAGEAPADDLSTKAENGRIVYPTVLSIGYNPYYANPTRSIEIHILSRFPSDFYGATLSLMILGYIRPEYDYVSLDALVEDIREDIRVAQRSLARDAYKKFRRDAFLRGEEDGQKDEEEKRLQGLSKGGIPQTGVCMVDP